MGNRILFYLALLLLPVARAMPIPPISPFTASPYIPFNVDEFDRPPHDCLVLARVFHKYDPFGRPVPYMWDSTPLCAAGYGPRAADLAKPEYTWLAREKDSVPDGRRWTWVAYGDLNVHEGDGWVARAGCVFEKGKHGCQTESEWLPPGTEVVNPYLEPEGSPLYAISRKVQSPNYPRAGQQPLTPRIQPGSKSTS